MKIWTYIQRGFGYGFGGAIGWRLGNLMFDLFGRIWKWAAAAFAAWAFTTGVVPQSVHDNARVQVEQEKARVAAIAAAKLQQMRAHDAQQARP